MDRRQLCEAWEGYFADGMRREGSLPPRFLPSNRPFSVHLARWYVAYSGRGLRVPLTDYIPEPFLGDMLSDAVRLVFLNLNPGRPLDGGEQLFNPQSAFGRQIDLHGYTRWARPNPYVTSNQAMGSRFWNRRLKFGRALCGPAFSSGEMLGMELWPWHSVQWGRFDVHLAAQALRACVVEPLCDLARARAGAGLPPLVVIAERREFVNVLPHLGFPLTPHNQPSAMLPSKHRQLYHVEMPCNGLAHLMVVVSQHMAGLPTVNGLDDGADLAEIVTRLGKRPG